VSTTAPPPVDFVIAWADTTDREWLRSRAQYSSKKAELSDEEFEAINQPWGTLRYLLRGIETHCPWVRTVYLVTPGQRPSWLVDEHPKLRVVDQDDLFDEGTPPTFNSLAIEMNLHKIPDIAEDFVYFNDDMLIVAPTPVEHFFPEGRPAGFAIMNALSQGDAHAHYLLNSIGAVNRHFAKRATILKRLSQWFSPRYGASVIRNLLLLPWPAFTGFYEPHLPMPVRTSTWTALWAAEPELMAKTTNSQFRALDNFSPYVMRYWQMCSGDFTPVSPKRYGRFYELGKDDIGTITEAIAGGRQRLVCVNDGDSSDFDSQITALTAALDTALPTPSAYERA
jgi:hypothetical protein